MTEISRAAVFHLTRNDGDTQPVQVNLTWDPSDPCAVHARFFRATGNNDDDVTWVLSRDVLAAGLMGRSGLADVTVYPIQAGLRIVLDSPSGHAEFNVDPDVIDEFLAATFDVVPGGQEYSDMDIEWAIAALFEAEAA